jgi:hypothetical protein
VRARFRATNGVVRDHHPARFIEFRSGGRVTGYSGCNRFTGIYVQKRGRVDHGGRLPQRAWPVRLRRQAFHALLGKVRYAEATRFKLTLKDSDDNVLAELIRRDPD